MINPSEEGWKFKCYLFPPELKAVHNWHSYYSAYLLIELVVLLLVKLGFLQMFFALKNCQASSNDHVANVIFATAVPTVIRQGNAVSA